MIIGLILCVVGVYFIFSGIKILDGTDKRWYLGPRIFPPIAYLFGIIPFGIAVIDESIAKLE